MRTLITFAAVLGGITLATSTASAEGVGIGVTVGEPTGLSVQFDVDGASAALNVGVGRDIDEHNHVHADYLWMAGGAWLGSGVYMPFYVGLGAFVKNHPDDMGPHGGARLPLGVELELARAPLEFFAELAPQLVVVESDPQDPHRALYLTGALGVRARF